MKTPIETPLSLSTLPSIVFQFSSDGVMLTDDQRNVIDINPKFELITGYCREEIIGKKPSILSSGVHDKKFYDEMSASLKTHGNWCGDIWNTHKNGEIYLENLSITTVYGNDKKPLLYLAMIRDITEQRLHRDKLEHESLYDPLTNLPNRKLLTQTLEDSIQKDDLGDNKICVFYLDLDGFKQVNDNLGHHVGDQVLVEIATRFNRCLHKKGIISRIGGDEFAGILKANKSDLHHFKTLHEILNSVTTPLNLKGQDVVLSASIGVTFWPQSEKIESNKLLQQADFAMYQAKRKGKNRFETFDQSHIFDETKKSP
ncbi:diguanylate cyclase [Marinomonas sp. 5E14-1]|uniref:sensor domain-containing protein n=1 Tax=Marinomonas sp. 5E14-1 TaxID=3153922 RepID=UPI003267130F